MELYQFECYEPGEEEAIEKLLYIDATPKQVEEVLIEFQNDSNQDDKWDLATFAHKLEQKKISYMYPEENAKKTFILE